MNDSKEKMGILVDSDIIIDVLTYREPFVNDSRVVLQSCEDGTQRGFITALILANTYYVLRKENSHIDVIKQLSKLIGFLDVINIDKAAIIKSMNSDFADFEDALQNYAAEVSDKVDTIVTRNTKDYKHSSISVMSPSEFANSL
ncbi:MAG: PIN domain-containing protein [Ekhidna sp.]|uniref:PIN domain-containing protein n=1 Tax=Ekhidna sp. TaxID=2608089 RepID=UPI0032EF52A3